MTDYMLWKYVRAFHGKRMMLKTFENFEDLEKYMTKNWYNMYCFLVQRANEPITRIDDIMSRNWPGRCDCRMNMDICD